MLQVSQIVMVEMRIVVRLLREMVYGETHLVQDILALFAKN